METHPDRYWQTALSEAMYRKYEVDILRDFERRGGEGEGLPGEEDVSESESLSQWRSVAKMKMV